ncbi:MAG TPA: DUF222 domain-containing protein [Arthrobacter sp.]|nr:DUF222 domain-containing protein [Arthrobacter sp.]
MGISGQDSGLRAEASGAVPAAGSEVTTAVAGSVDTARPSGLLINGNSISEAIPGHHAVPSTPVDPAAEDVGTALEDGATALGTLRDTALDAARMFDFYEAADFAGHVEDLSRTIEYLQIVAAQAVERTREEAKNTSRSRSAVSSRPTWRTGWAEPESSTADPAETPAAAAGSILDDGYRNAAEFLRARLRIEVREARRRLALAATLLPSTTLTGQTTPPRHEHLAAALATALVPTRAATIITGALDRVAFIAEPGILAAMEHALTRTATETDPDFLARTARRWIDRIDQDGHEPSEEELRTIQGAFLRKPRRGLHHIEIFATAEQYETLTTVMNAATNPRLTTAARAVAMDTAVAGTEKEQTGWAPELDRRSRAQKLLDGLVGGCALALKTGKLPANGGLKPQVNVYIGAEDLCTQLSPSGIADPTTNQSSIPPRLSTGTGTFTGPLHPETIRKIACDADILPVLLGTDGQILDIGRTSRVFPPHIRKALNARDQGCAFPDCTMPAPWCEAHHITYWSQGGPTSTDNGVLLCSHHHHLIHQEQWKITAKNGVPWFTPPPHVDPTQTPRQNHHRRPLRI